MLSQPSSWTFINGSHPDLIPCFLNRSKNAPLDAYIPVSPSVSEVIEHINPHIDRLNSLHFFIPVDDIDHVSILRDLKAPPRLRRLNIKCQGFTYTRNPIFTPGIVEPIQSINHLQLSGFPITQPLSQLGNLTFVSLKDNTSPLDVHMDLFAENPFLRVIHLRGSRLRKVGMTGFYPPGSISLPYLELLSSEKTPLIDLEALSPPHGARIFHGFGQGRDRRMAVYPTSDPIPESFSNLQDLRKLSVVDEGDIYVKVEGEKGSVTYYSPFEPPIGPGMFRGIPLEEITDATYETHPPYTSMVTHQLSTSQPIISRILVPMARLQRLQLSRLDAPQTEYFLLVLHSTKVCRDLKVLVLFHCTRIYQRMRDLATMAEGRKAAGIGLDAVRIIQPDIESLRVRFRPEDVFRLERAIGALEYEEAKQDRSPLKLSSLRFDHKLDEMQPYMFF